MESSLKELVGKALRSDSIFYKRIFEDRDSGQEPGDYHKREFALQRKV